jgi:FKBP-type peptidyl-prolyl cis-trans isomerase
MKLSRFIVIALVALISVPTVANAKKPKTNKKGKAVAAKVDTVSVKEFSYAMGMANTQGLDSYLSQRMGVDPAFMNDFIKGFEAYTNSEADKKQVAASAGIQIHQQVNDMVMNNIDHQIADNDSVKTLDREQFVKGFIAGLKKDTTNMKFATAQKVAETQMEYYHHELNIKKYASNLKEGEAFIKANAKKDSVKILPSGVQYKILKVGTGALPKDTSEVEVNYEGKTIDGKVFDSSYKRKKTATFRCNQVIKGWTEALTHMPVGSTWEIFIPQQLGYGEREAGQIKPYSALIFKVELLKITK